MAHLIATIWNGKKIIALWFRGGHFIKMEDGGIMCRGEVSMWPYGCE